MKLWSRLLPILAALPVVYVLSVGPVSRFFIRKGVDLPPPAVVAFYFPVRWACAHSELFAHVMVWYVDRWDVRSKGQP